ncbi:MAG: selenocysteine-specific translation elongation factor [Actinomycetota bacterium]
MFVIGTSGHVDHGKSTLVKRLTGIDPDRLSEEKERGLTIDLGFAWFTTASGKEVGIVDVPGHERFVHNMLAGCGSLDAVLFVVDGAEGWKEQSEEHLAILDLLGVKRGVIAITKSDIAPGAEEVRKQIVERTAGTALEDSAIVAVSALTGAGVDELVHRIDSVIDHVPQRDLNRPRLFIDRSFSIKGSGTVVTGTLSGGSITVGDEIVMLPSGAKARVRGIQSHKTAIEKAVPTSRVALNLAGAERSSIERGDAIVLPGRFLPTNTVDVELHAVRNIPEPVSSKGAYLLYLGSAEVHARVRVFGDEFARVTTNEPIVAQPNDRFVLRDIGRSRTVAGGRILDAHPIQGRIQQDRIDKLRARATTSDFASATVKERDFVRAEELEQLSGSAIAKQAIRLPSHWISDSYFTRIEQTLIEALERFHAEHPLEKGAPKDSLRSELGIEDPRLFLEIVDAIDRVGLEGTIVRLASHRVVIHDPEKDELAGVITNAGFAPPSRSELEARFGALVKALIDSGDLVSISPSLVLTSEQLQQAKDLIAQKANDGITASAVKDLLGTSRKYAIPLLEYLDAIGFTKRNGDVRVVR